MPDRGTTMNRAQRPCLRGVWTYMQKNSKMRVHCTAHHHQQLVFFSTPTHIKDSVGDDGGEEACLAGRAADSATLFDLLLKK